MFSSVFGATCAALLPLLCVPEFDCAVPPPPPNTRFFGDYVIEAHLLNGTTETVAFGFGPTPHQQTISDNLSRILGRQGFGYRQDGLRVAILHYQGVPVRNITMNSTAPPMKWGWVPRPPKVELGSVRAVLPQSSTFVPLTDTVRVFLVPELNFGDIPPQGKRPRVFHMYVVCHLASGATSERTLSIGPNTDIADMAEAYFDDTISGLHRDGSRLVVLDFHGDRVIGISVTSTGPLPKVNWVVRPEYLKK